MIEVPKEGENKMRVLITITKSPTHKYLVHLFAKALIRQVRDLVNNKKHSQAVALAFANVRLEREVLDKGLPTIEADLILSEHNARWDLKK